MRRFLKTKHKRSDNAECTEKYIPLDCRRGPRQQQHQPRSKKRRLKFRRDKHTLREEAQNSEDLDKSSKENLFENDEITNSTSSSQAIIPEFSYMSEMSLLYNSYSNDPHRSQGPLSLINPAQTDRLRSKGPQSRLIGTKNLHKDKNSKNSIDEEAVRNWLDLTDDPTVEESVECVFSHQLMSGDVLIDIPTGIESMDSSSCTDDFDESVASPTRGKVGSDEEDFTSNNSCFTSGSLVHVGSFVPSHIQVKNNRHSNKPDDSVNEKYMHFDSGTSSPHSGLSCVTTGVSLRYCCQSCLSRDNRIPMLSPKDWPQFPLLLRPTPGSGTRVLAIRFIDSEELLMTFDRGRENTLWWESLQNIWGESENYHRSDLKDENRYCPECCCIPINNGNEKEGKSLVVDFESPLFMGTILVRMRGSGGTTPESYDDSIGYFNGVNRQYQVVIRGRFKKEIPMTECYTGQSFSDPLNLPPSYVCKGSMKILNFFAPKMQAKFNGSKPVILSPLGSTPQTIYVDNEREQMCRHLSDQQAEPIDESKMLIPLGHKVATLSSVGRSKARKKAFDKLCSIDDKTSTFSTDKVYTFEFLQHLLKFQEFEMSLGKMLGKFKMSQLLNGQPLKIMACHQRPLSEGDCISIDCKVLDGCALEPFWSFDIFHESIIQRP